MLLTTTTFLRTLLTGRTVRTAHPRLDPADLPRSLDPFALRIGFEESR